MFALRVQRRLWRRLWIGVLALSLLFLPTGAEAAGLFQKAGGTHEIFLGEVQSYGDTELKKEYFDTFADKLSEALRDAGFDTIANLDMTNEAGRHEASGSASEAESLSELHMDAIVHGHQYDRAYTAAKLAHYADRVMGRAYFADDAKLDAWRKQPELPYRLSPDKQDLAVRLAAKYQAKYLLFVNLKNVDVRLKHGIFATHTDRETKGKKMQSQLDYYLVRGTDGKVYEGHIEDKKSAQMIDFGLGKTGKDMNVDTLLNQVLEVQAREITEDMAKRGLPALRE